MWLVSIVIDVVPSVIEPSFGIGRILYAILEHNFRKREGDEMRNYLSLPPIISPVGCSVLPLSGNNQFDPFVKTIGKTPTTLAILFLNEYFKNYF